MTRCILIIILSMMVTTSYSQSAKTYLLDGDKRYTNQDYGSAEELYRKATQSESSLESNFNLGNSTYMQGRYEEAVDYYMNAAKKAPNKTQESKAFYNLGNAYFQNEALEEAAEAYKQAIRLDPENKKAQYNLGVAKELRKQMQQQQQQQEQQQDGDGEEQEDQEQQDQEEQEGDKNSEDQQEGENQEDQEEKSDSTEQQMGEPSAFDSTRLDKQTLDSLDAAKLLEIIQSEEQKVQEKLRKFNAKRKKPDKDW